MPVKTYITADAALALAIASVGIACDIPRGFDDAPCHLGICTREQCQRCRRADFFYAALDRYNEEKRSELKKVWAGERERKKVRDEAANFGKTVILPEIDWDAPFYDSDGNELSFTNDAPFYDSDGNELSFTNDAPFCDSDGNELSFTNAEEREVLRRKANER